MKHRINDDGDIEVTMTVAIHRAGVDLLKQWLKDTDYDGDIDDHLIAALIDRWCEKTLCYLFAKAEESDIYESLKSLGILTEEKSE